MVEFATIKPGDLLFESSRVKMGNTTLSRLECWRVRVIEVGENHVIASWNGNTPKRYYRSAARRWTRTPPKGTAEREAFERGRRSA